MTDDSKGPVSSDESCAACDHLDAARAEAACWKERAEAAEKRLGEEVTSANDANEAAAADRAHERADARKQALEEAAQCFDCEAEYDHKVSSNKVALRIRALKAPTTAQAALGPAKELPCGHEPGGAVDGVLMRCSLPRDHHGNHKGAAASTMFEWRRRW